MKEEAKRLEFVPSPSTLNLAYSLSLSMDVTPATNNDSINLNDPDVLRQLRFSESSTYLDSNLRDFKDEKDFSYSEIGDNEVKLDNATSSKAVGVRIPPSHKTERTDYVEELLRRDSIDEGRIFPLSL